MMYKEIVILEQKNYDNSDKSHLLSTYYVPITLQANSINIIFQKETL